MRTFKQDIKTIFSLIHSSIYNPHISCPNFSSSRYLTSNEVIVRFCRIDILRVNKYSVLWGSIQKSYTPNYNCEISSSSSPVAAAIADGYAECDEFAL
jgi:hypothetical protein